MKTEQHRCNNCETQTEHVMIGFVPQFMFEDAKSHAWIKASVCAVCGSLITQAISEREMDWAERRFLWALVDTGNMSKEDAQEILDT